MQNCPNQKNKGYTTADGSKSETRRFLFGTGSLKNYRKSILLLRTSVFGSLRYLQFIFAVIYEKRSSNHK